MTVIAEQLYKVLRSANFSIALGIFYWFCWFLWLQTCITTFSFLWQVYCLFFFLHSLNRWWVSIAPYWQVLITWYVLSNCQRVILKSFLHRWQVVKKKAMFWARLKWDGCLNILLGNNNNNNNKTLTRARCVVFYVADKESDWQVKIRRRKGDGGCLGFDFCSCSLLQ